MLSYSSPFAILADGFILLLVIGLIGSLNYRYLAAKSRRLQLNKEHYRTLFERSVTGKYRAGLDGAIFDMNNACAELLGYADRKDALSRGSFFSHMSQEYAAETLRVLKQSKRLNQREVQLQRIDGTPIWVMHNATLIDPMGDIPGEIQGMFLNIDELKRTEQELRSAKQLAENASLAKSQFLSNMSHELRTPLNAIIGLTDLLIETSAMSDEDRDALRVVRSSGVSLLQNVSNILQLAKLDANHPELHPELHLEEFDLRHLIELETTAASKAASAKGLSFSSDVCAELNTVFRADPDAVRQILSALLSNAVKFTDRGGIRLNVDVDETSAVTQMVKISVQDTGIGIPPDKGIAIFEPFSQADNSDTRRFGGTGLGLTLVSKLVDSMNGEFAFRSEIGRGSTFWVVLPLHTAEKMCPEKAEQPLAICS